MKKLFFGMLALAGLLMGSCSADDEIAVPKSNAGLQMEDGPGGGSGINPPPPPPKP